MGVVDSSYHDGFYSIFQYCKMLEDNLFIRSIHTSAKAVKRAVWKVGSWRGAKIIWKLSMEKKLKGENSIKLKLKTISVDAIIILRYVALFYSAFMWFMKQSRCFFYCC